jgi:hypothetical protein
MFLVLHTQKAPSAILNALLCTGSSLLICALLADPWAALPYSRADKTIISCTLSSIPWSAPHFIPARHYNRFILLNAFALVSLM